MYAIEDLFDHRELFSANLERFMESRSLTKANYCKTVGISRPTLDKLLNADITNAANFKKHVTKILDSFHISLDVIMGAPHYSFIRMRELKKALNISDDEITAATGIHRSKLKDIEAGAARTSLSNLRDIALCCKTSTRGLLGTNYFDVSLSTPFDFVSEPYQQKTSGFWGHIGILTSSGNEYLWYPISLSVKNSFYNMLNQPFILIPCMNNKVLLLNMSGINNIILLDDACDEPSVANWDPSVSHGEIPPVVYEALDDFMDMRSDGRVDHKRISASFYNYLKELLTQNQWSEEDIIQLLFGITVYYKNSYVLSTASRLDLNQTLTYAFQFLYDFQEISPEDMVIYFTNIHEEELFINLNNISLIEAPFCQLENVILQGFEQHMTEAAQIR